jgi:ADP-ribose pyrophosphatase
MTEPEMLYNGRYLNLRRRGSWEFAERTNPGGAAIILALTSERKLLLVEQYRVPIQSPTIEMPAGLIGDLDASEDWRLSAQRELTEETGYAAERFERIMGGPSSAGMSTETVCFVRAHGLRRVGAGGGDASEQITVHEVPLDQAAAWIASKMGQGYSIDPKLYAGLYFLHFDLNGQALRD